MNQTIEQRRAKHALGRIEEAERQNVNYRSYVEALPAHVVMNGLGQAMATLNSKEKNSPQKQLYRDVEAWLLGEHGPLRDRANSLAHAIAECTQTDYLHAQTEALAYLTWLKKFAKAAFPKSETRDD